MPIKAIEASIKSRKERNGNSEHGKRRDVIHKAFFRAMKRYYSEKFETAFGAKEITKEEFKRHVIAFTDATVMQEAENKVPIDQLTESSKSSEECSKQGMLNVMMTLISHKLAKN
mmetsp:Transcript_7373/g.6532  ORF Transcript_7373/g.6532 Transcript_7373/m.6532 type:complete len:115 (-) Transcript_7373:290-634(-)